jgi:tetratricopeptide (TPR) repeat protein
VLRGSFIKAGESFVITAGLQKPGTAESSTPLRLEADNEKDIIVKVDELTRQVKEGLNLTAAQISGDIENEAGKITTSSPEALKYYVEGRRHQYNAEGKQAVAFYEKAVEIDPEFAMAYRALSMQRNDMAIARKYLKKALELSARLPEGERLLIEANWYDVEEDYARAIEVLEELLKIYPHHNLGIFWLAYVYDNAGDIGKAIERYEICVQNQKTAINFGNLANAYMEKGLYQKAEDVCRSFLKDVQDNAYVREELVTSYLCRREFDPALAEAEKLYLLSPSDKEYKGRVLFFKDDFAGAEKILGRDALLLIRGKFEENVNISRQNLEKSKGDKEKEANAYGGLSWALRKAGRYEEAYRASDQYLKLSAENRKSAGESGLPYLPSQQKSDLFWKGRIQTEMKSFAEAQKTAEELKSVIEKGINTKEMRDFFSKACNRLNFETEWDGEPAPFFDNLARALYQSGDLDKARKTYERITLLTWGRYSEGNIYARAYYMLGKIGEQQGDKPRARTNYRKFLDLWKDADPGLPEVADAKKRLAALGS